MRITKIELENFKKVSRATLDVGAITVLVGGNDSGKSSFVQGMHFALMAANAFHMAGKKTFPQERLLYCPTLPFFRLGNSGEYANLSGFLKLRLTFESEEKIIDQQIKIYRAKNDNVGFEYLKSSAEVTKLMQSPSRLFSVYVPGVAGIGRSEPLHQKGQIKRGIASGDANLYLRSVLYCIQREGKLDTLRAHVKTAFPHFFIRCIFDEENDAEVSIEVSTAQGGIPTVPLELAATGVLQVLQLFAYVTLFEPRLLLLDEPDSHIHPDRQQTLARALVELAKKTGVQIVLTTHSKHLMAALQGDARFFAFSRGISTPLETDQEWAWLLTDLGVVSQLESLRGGTIDFLILTEDTNSVYLQSVLQSNGVKLDRCLFSSYGTSSQLHSAVFLAKWAKARYPNCKVVIHRDRDFMTDEELEVFRKKLDDPSFEWLFTHGADVESYFCEEAVLAEILGRSVDDTRTIVEQVACKAHNALVQKFTNKRTESRNLVKAILKSDASAPKAPILSDDNPLPKSQRFGKLLLSRIVEELPKDHKRLRPQAALTLKSLRQSELQAIFKK
ncbi:MAG: AAA family ATPase [Burkholderiales bacterium]|nr:AAA family ATPase [Burkholderiales bacterium]